MPRNCPICRGRLMVDADGLLCLNGHRGNRLLEALGLPGTQAPPRFAFSCGHPKTKENIIVKPDGPGHKRRYCKQCTELIMARD